MIGVPRIDWIEWDWTGWIGIWKGKWERWIRIDMISWTSRSLRHLLPIDLVLCKRWDVGFFQDVYIMLLGEVWVSKMNGLNWTISPEYQWHKLWHQSSCREAEWATYLNWIFATVLCHISRISSISLLKTCNNPYQVSNVTFPPPIHHIRSPRPIENHVPISIPLLPSHPLISPLNYSISTRISPP